MMPRRSMAYVVVQLVLLVLFVPFGGASAQTAQQRVHTMSHEVMPFDVAKTVHVFKMTELGGIERVVARDPKDVDQIALIREHLKHEAERFKHGDYGDPAKLHGADMPGLSELSANPSAIYVTYSEVPAGAEITFKATSLHMLTAIHRWFGAQLSEHGADARAE